MSEPFLEELSAAGLDGWTGESGDEMGEVWNGMELN